MSAPDQELSLPPGWTITERTEEVPNPNFGTVFGYPFFTRKTYDVKDSTGKLICSDGSDLAACSQAWSLFETSGRFEAGNR